MLKSDKALLHQLPVRVIFAGFESDTLTLGQAGWDLSLEQHMSMSTPRPQLRLAMRHGSKENALYAITHPVDVRHTDILGAHHDGFKLKSFYESIVFMVAHIQTGISFRTVMPEHSRAGASFLRDSFMPFDPTPQKLTEEEIKDFKFFKVAKEPQELIVDPKQVHELLDMILKMQGPEQKEIRARDRSRANHEAYRSGEMFNTKPAHTVQAQIITLAG